ncbi:hypothetical protein [Mesorhizobium huakuii]|uniref:Uncharacterized protein n=1 Tax=Mesorhizobium huakuii TaxID=28104 RepID=A0A7G6T5D5_9HYPH|nr:hypothetical protein [Mesorhizobium huakuii]QND61967.1 hypothetical protein HB778_38150 [Mesorhizobium huakuii]
MQRQYFSMRLIRGGHPLGRSECPCIERARRKLCQTNGQQVCDRVGYLLTADSDQVATAKMFRERFPDKQIISAARRADLTAKEILPHVHDIRSIEKATIEACQFEGAVIIVNGERVAKRPAEYAPPETAAIQIAN